MAQAKPAPKPVPKTGGEKYSDQLANGDRSDDKEIQDIQDPRDAIADDNGFVNQYRTNWAQKKSQNEWRDYEGVQLGADLVIPDENDTYIGKYNQYAQSKDLTVSPGSFSQELVDGDKTDDIQVEKEDTFEEDGAVEDTMMVQLGGMEGPHTSKGQQEKGQWWD